MDYQFKLSKKNQTILLAFIWLSLIILILFHGGINLYGPFILEISVFLITLMWFYWFSKKNYVLNISKYHIFLLLFAIWAFLSAWLSGSTYFGFSRSREWIAFCLLVFISSQLFSSYTRIFSFQVFIVVIGVFEAVIGIFQFFVFDLSRTTGTFLTYSNFYSHFLGIAFLISLWWIFKSTIKRTRTEKLLVWLPSLVIATSLFLSGSRIIFFLLIPISFFASTWRKRIPLLISLIIILIIGFIILRNIGGRNIIGDDPYHMTRLDIWNQSVRLFMEKPIMGHGPGSFSFVSHHENFPNLNSVIRYGKIAKYAHQNYLELAVETGIVGLIFFSMLIFGALKNFFHTDKKLEGSIYLTSLIIIWIVIVGFFDTFMYPPFFEFLFAILLGIVLPVKEYKFSGRTGIRIKKIALITIIVFMLWTLLSLVGTIMLNKVVKGIQSGDLREVNRSEKNLQFVSYFIPSNPDIPLLNSYIYEFYYITSENKTWLELSYKYAREAASDDISPHRLERAFILSEKLGYKEDSKEIIKRLFELQPYNLHTILNRIKYEDDIEKKIEFLNFAKDAEPNSIDIAAELFRYNIISDKNIISWNFDSLLDLSNNMKETLFVSNFYAINKISNILLYKGRSEEALRIWRRIIPIYDKNENFIYIYTAFLKNRDFNFELDEFIDHLDSITTDLKVIDSLIKMGVIK